jgi:hypothetical protein
MRRTETIIAALNVLRCCIDRRLPNPDEVAILRNAIGANAKDMEWDELARTVVENYINEARKDKPGSVSV